MCQPDPPALGAEDTTTTTTTTTPEDVNADAPPPPAAAAAAATLDEVIEVDIKDIDSLSVGKEEDDDKEEQDVGCGRRAVNKVMAFYRTNEFLILIVLAILLARAYPPLGADYLQPDITATWLAVCFIFLMAGLGLKTEEFSKALQRVWFNLFVQCFNFFVVSSTVYGASRLLAVTDVLSQDLADGMVVAASLPMTINMVLVLTKSAGGAEAAAIFNAAAGNMVGVFLSPVLILGYLGVTGDIDLLEVFYKLALRVVVPVIVGQLLQKNSEAVVHFVKTHKSKFKTAQQLCLVFIVYTVFCRTFEDGSDSSIGDIFLMILFQFIFLVALMVLAWFSLKLVFPNQPKLRVMGLFGCTHKTVAMGVPLINAIYESDPAVGLYTLPLLIWHPMQLVIGTFLAPKLANFIKREQERLGIVEDENGNEVTNEVLEERNADVEAAATNNDEERIPTTGDEEPELDSR
jgi:sodium/bile acid cotransporter 7